MKRDHKKRVLPIVFSTTLALNGIAGIVAPSVYADDIHIETTGEIASSTTTSDSITTDSIQIPEVSQKKKIITPRSAGVTFQKYADLNTYTSYIMTNDAIYAYKDDKLKKFDLTGKAIQWEVASDSGNYSGDIYISKNGDIFVGTANGYVTSFSQDGTPLKKYKVPGAGPFISIAVGSNGDVYATRCEKEVSDSYGSQSYLYCIRSTGTFKWRSDYYAYGWNDTPNHYILYIGDKFLIVSRDSYTSWIRMDDGKEIESAYNKTIANIDITNNKLYTMDYSDLTAYTLTSGKREWSTTLGSWNRNITYATISSDGNTAYVSTQKGPFYAVDTNTHKVLWKFDEGTPNWGRAVTDAQGNIYVSQSNDDVKMYYMYKFSPDGQILDTIELAAPADNLYMRPDGSFYYVNGKTVYSSSVPTPAVTLQSIAADTTNVTLPIGQTKAIKLTGAYSDGSTKDITSQASWSSDNTTIATVSGGSITAVKTGAATITASYQGKTITVPVTVPAAGVEITKLTADTSALNLSVGQTKNVKLTATYSDNSTKDVTNDAGWEWVSTNPSTVSVVKGAVTAKAAGSATITASYQGKSFTINVTVSTDTTVPPTSPETFSKVYNFSELISDTTLFNQVLSEYTANELKVIVPERYLKKIVATHVPNILTNIDVTTGTSVRKVDVISGSDTRSAQRTGVTAYNVSWAGLAKGSEIIVVVKDSSGQELERKVIRLKEGTNTVEQDPGDVQSGNYSLISLISNIQFFNKVLNSFSLNELKIGVPMRYLGEINVQHNVYTTTFQIQTAGTVGKVVIITSDGTENQAQAKGNGLYTRDIPGLESNDSVTVRVYDENGRILQEKPVFID